MVLVKKWPFLNFFFQANVGQENVFYDILERKKAFLGYKKQEVQKIEKLTFFHGDWAMVVVKKMAILPTLFFLGQGKCLLEYSRPKKSLSRL